eukprot:GHVH01002996.1.p1 GENE.GHVH01002996.1~~GHVH01002996.1.p1  ORF type:complete len:353 (-),score=46.28 GHVH01002996.1:47-1105(-)
MPEKHIKSEFAQNVKSHKDGYPGAYRMYDISNKPIKPNAESLSELLRKTVTEALVISQDTNTNLSSLISALDKMSPIFVAKIATKRWSIINVVRLQYVFAMVDLDIRQFHRLVSQLIMFLKEMNEMVQFDRDINWLHQVVDSLSRESTVVYHESDAMNLLISSSAEFIKYLKEEASFLVSVVEHRRSWTTNPLTEFVPNLSDLPQLSGIVKTEMAKASNGGWNYPAQPGQFGGDPKNIFRILSSLKRNDGRNATRTPMRMSPDTELEGFQRNNPMIYSRAPAVKTIPRNSGDCDVKDETRLDSNKLRWYLWSKQFANTQTNYVEENMGDINHTNLSGIFTSDMRIASDDDRI